MDGGRYFTIRDRLEPVAAGVAELAGRHGIEAAGMVAVGDGEVGPGRRLMLVVFGETNAGKSSLLNSLFGRAVCPVDALPDRGPMVWYGVGGRAGLPAGMAWRELPADVRLRGFEWIDTPGVNGLDDDGRRLLLDCCGRADGVLAVLHAANPWEPATWDVLARLGEDVLDRTVVVLAQTDRKDPADLPVLRSHLRELSLRKVGRELPVVPVSAARAWSAWPQQGGVDAARWKAAGFGDLEGEIRQRICEAPERMAELRSWWGRVLELLRAAEVHIEQGGRLVEGEGRFLAEVEAELAIVREKVIGELDEGSTGYHRAGRRIHGWFSRRLGLLPSFIRCLAGDDSGPRLDRLLVGECAAAARQQAAGDADWIEGACAGFWESIEDRAREHLGVEVGGFEVVRGRLAVVRGRFVEHCAEAVAALAGEIRPGAAVAEDLRRRQRMLAGMFGVLLALSAAAGTLGAVGRAVLAGWLLVAAALVFGVTVVLAWTSGRFVLRVLDDRLRDRIGSLAPGVHDARVDEVRGYFAQFSRALEPLRRRVAESRGDLQPELERWNGLFLELQAVGQEIS